MKPKTVLLSVAALLLSVRPVDAATHLVKPDGTGEYPTIQIALNACATGDTVLLAPGTYVGPVNGQIHWPGQRVTLSSQQGPEQTVIRNFDFDISVQGSDGSVLGDVTIQQSSQWSVLVNNRDATIRNCIFDATSRIWLLESSSIIERCRFQHVANALNVNGPADASIIRNNIFTDNDFGGVLATIDGESAFVNNTLVANRGSGIGAAVIVLSDSPYVANNIFANNTGAAAIGCSVGTTPVVACNNIYGNAGNGAGCGTMPDNFSADAKFCDEITFGLMASSPCAPANSPCGALVGAIEVSCGECPGSQSMSAGQSKRVNIVLSNRAPASDLIYYVVSSNSGVTFVADNAPGNFASLIFGSKFVGGNDTAMTAIWAKAPGDASPGDTLGFQIIQFASSQPGQVDTCTCVIVIGSEPVGVAQSPGPNALLRVSPTPFSNHTMITYGVGSASSANLSIYDVNGRKVRTLVEASRATGPRTIAWDGADAHGLRAASGVYFVRLTVHDHAVTQKVLLLR